MRAGIVHADQPEAAPDEELKVFQDKTYREFRYEASRFRLATLSDGTTRISLSGGSRETTPGHPDLPLVAERVELPAGTRLAAVRLLEADTAPLAGGVRVPSAERPRRDLDGLDRTAPDPEIFGSAGFVPGRLRGRRADVVFLGTAGLGTREEEYRDAYWRGGPVLTSALAVGLLLRIDQGAGR